MQAAMSDMVVQGKVRIKTSIKAINRNKTENDELKFKKQEQYQNHF